MEGETAEFGGVLTVVSLTLVLLLSTVLELVVVLVLRDVESVVMTSDCANDNVDMTKSNKNVDVFNIPVFLYALYYLWKSDAQKLHSTVSSS